MGWSSQYYYERLLCDVNVDGKMDIVGFGHNDIFISIFNAQNNMFEPAYSAGEGFGFGCFYDQNNTNRESGISNGKAIVKNSVHYDYRGCECLASCHRRILVDLVFNYNTSTHKYEAEVDWNSIPTITGYGVISCHPRYPWECN